MKKLVAIAAVMVLSAGMTLSAQEQKPKDQKEKPACCASKDKKDGKSDKSDKSCSDKKTTDTKGEKSCCAKK
ncbi:MAG: hypothetical protein KBS98_00910 [Flavobacterium sp.]|nr:hypothetical protein [Candidatus Neoflavobacterium equi]